MKKKKLINVLAVTNDSTLHLDGLIRWLISRYTIWYNFVPVAHRPSSSVKLIWLKSKFGCLVFLIGLTNYNLVY